MALVAAYFHDAASYHRPARKWRDRCPARRSIDGGEKILFVGPGEPVAQW